MSILVEDGDQMRVLMGPVSSGASFTAWTVCKVLVDRIEMPKGAVDTATRRPSGLGLQCKEASWTNGQRLILLSLNGSQPRNFFLTFERPGMVHWSWHGVPHVCPGWPLLLLLLCSRHRSLSSRILLPTVGKTNRSYPRAGGR